MKKLNFILIAISIFSNTWFSNIYAQFDTVSVKLVASGVKHYHLVDKSKPWNMNVMEVDLRNEYISLETGKAKNNVKGNAKTSDMAKEHSYAGHEVIGAINGDFYDGDGITIGHQVINGQLLRSIQGSDWSKFAFDTNNTPAIERFKYKGQVLYDNKTNVLNGVNVTRGENQLILYNKYLGSSTLQNEWGTEVLLKPIDDWMINDTVRCVVLSNEVRKGNMKIVEGNIVLSGHGLGEDFVKSFQNDDTVSVVVGMTPGSMRIKQMISGFPKIVKDGKNYAVTGYREEGGNATFHTDRHPRTSIGISQDSTKLYLFVIDGRLSSSIGMSLIELADFMVKFGVYQGINLDGGGSSTMIVKHKLVNVPSDGSGERSVSNALFIVSSETAKINEINLTPDSVVTNLEKPVSYKLTAFDEYGYEKSLSFEDINFTLTNNSIGSFNSGIFEPASTGKSQLIASYQNGRDTTSISVEVYEGDTLLHSFESLDDLTLTGKDLNLDMSVVSLNTNDFTEGNSSLELDYIFQYRSGNYNYAYIDCDIPLKGVPDYLSLDVLGEGLKHTLAFIVTDENDEEFALVCNKQLISEQFETYSADFLKPIAMGNNYRFYFPIKLKRIAFALDCAKVNEEIYSGKIIIDNLKLVYPETTSTDNLNILPSEFKLMQNYPNPFNPATTISYSVPVETFVNLSIFNTLGQKVAVLVDKVQKPGNYKYNFKAGTISSGIYLYRIKTKSYTEVKKMIYQK